MTEQEKRLHRCAFTGHRSSKLTIPDRDVKRLLRKAILKAYNEGYNEFISGVSEGADLWAAEIVLRLREIHPDIRLICAIPFPEQENKWEQSFRKKYHKIIDRADESVIVCEHYFRGCFQLRNKWMIDRCSKLIAVWSGQSGGTKNTVDYARKQNIEIINVLETK